MRDLPLNEILPEKWQRQLDWPKTKLGRRVFQNFYTGRMKLSREMHTNAMTSEVISEKKFGLTKSAPIWRLIRGDEADRLWTMEVYWSYYNHKSVWAKSNFTDYHRRLQGVQIPNETETEILGAIGLTKKQREIIKTAEEKNKAAADFKKFQPMADEILAYLLGVAVKARSERDIEQKRLKEQEIFLQEEMRERARASVLARAKSTWPEGDAVPAIMPEYLRKVPDLPKADESATPYMPKYGSAGGMTGTASGTSKFQDDWFKPRAEDHAQGEITSPDA